MTTIGAGTKYSPILLLDNEEDIPETRIIMTKSVSLKRKQADSHLLDSTHPTSPRSAESSARPLLRGKRQRTGTIPTNVDSFPLGTSTLHPSTTSILGNEPMTGSQWVNSMALSSVGARMGALQQHPQTPDQFIAERRRRRANPTPAIIPHPPPTVSAPKSKCIIGMSSDQDAPGVRGSFHPSSSTICHTSPNFPYPHTPTPNRTIILDQLPKSCRDFTFFQTWCKAVSGSEAIFIAVDPVCAKALLEFPTKKFATKAWGSPRMGVPESRGISHKGRSREDLIRAWWYKPKGETVVFHEPIAQDDTLDDDVVEITPFQLPSSTPLPSGLLGKIAETVPHPPLFGDVKTNPSTLQTISNSAAASTSHSRPHDPASSMISTKHQRAKSSHPSNSRLTSLGSHLLSLTPLHVPTQPEMTSPFQPSEISSQQPHLLPLRSEPPFVDILPPPFPVCSSARVDTQTRVLSPRPHSSTPTCAVQPATLAPPFEPPKPQMKSPSPVPSTTPSIISTPLPSGGEVIPSGPRAHLKGQREAHTAIADPVTLPDVSKSALIASNDNQAASSQPSAVLPRLSPKKMTPSKKHRLKEKRDRLRAQQEARTAATPPGESWAATAPYNQWSDMAAPFFSLPGFLPQSYSPGALLAMSALEQHEMMRAMASVAAQYSAGGTLDYGHEEISVDDEEVAYISPSVAVESTEPEISTLVLVDDTSDRKNLIAVTSEDTSPSGSSSTEQTDSATESRLRQLVFASKRNKVTATPTNVSPARAFEQESIPTGKRKDTHDIASNGGNADMTDPATFFIEETIRTVAANGTAMSSISKTSATIDGTVDTTKVQLAEKQRLLEQKIAESKMLMERLSQATSKIEKNAILAQMRQQSRPKKALVIGPNIWPNYETECVLVVSDNEDDDF